MIAPAKSRLDYVDWMRGLACLLMFQTHCYDSWLGGQARRGEFFHWSQLVGTFPAPLFLFLAGISFGLVTDKMRAKGVPANEIARVTMLRGAEIFGLGMLFRWQEFLLGQPGAPWTDLLRVDVLNTIGISMALMGAMCRVAQTRAAAIAASTGITLAIAMLTPPLWTDWRPRGLPWWIESYVNGVHTFGEPQPWLFPIFPWTAFAFAGLAAGFVVFNESARQREVRTLTLAGVGGAGLAGLAWLLDAHGPQLYAVYDFWHTSPNFFLIRLGMLLMILCGCFAWNRWGWGARGFSPLVQMGRTSMLVYWAHIEFVYGRFSLLPKRGVGIELATVGLAGIFGSMLLVSLVRTRLKRK